MEKEMKIIPPVGYEIDVENSTFNCIKFKPIKQELTYGDVCKEVFKEDRACYINLDGLILRFNTKLTSCEDANEAPTKEQLEKILAINQLQNIANYYNKGWKPNWKDGIEDKYAICFSECRDIYEIGVYGNINYGIPVFKRKEDAQAVIDNPNFRDILDKIYKS